MERIQATLFLKPEDFDFEGGFKKYFKDNYDIDVLQQYPKFRYKYQ